MSRYAATKSRVQSASRLRALARHTSRFLPECGSSRRTPSTCRVRSLAYRSSFDLQRQWVTGREVRRLIHGFDLARTDSEHAGVDHFQEIDILLRTPRVIGLKERRAVIMKFASRVPPCPPRWFLG